MCCLQSNTIWASCSPLPDALLPRAACASACCFVRLVPLPCPQRIGFLPFLRMMCRLCSAFLNGRSASGAAAMKRHRSGARSACAVNVKADPTPGPAPVTPCPLPAGSSAGQVIAMKPRRSATSACFASAVAAPQDFSSGLVAKNAGRYVCNFSFSGCCTSNWTSAPFGQGLGVQDTHKR